MSTLFGISSSLISTTNVTKNASLTASKVDAYGGKTLQLLRTDKRHLASDGSMPPLVLKSEPSFEDAMLKAMDGVNYMQVDSSNAIETMLINPKAIDAHDVTIAMAKANMSLSITRTLLDRVVKAWKDVINTR